MQMESLIEDLKDGSRLLALLQVLSGQKLVSGRVHGPSGRVCTVRRQGKCVRKQGQGVTVRRGGTVGRGGRVHMGWYGRKGTVRWGGAG